MGLSEPLDGLTDGGILPAIGPPQVMRFLSHHIQTSILDPAILPPLLRSVRASLYPNNAPGASTLVAPSSEEELADLRRRCASAIWALVPKSVGRLYFGSTSLWPGAGSAASCAAGPASVEKASDDNMITSRSGPPDSEKSAYSDNSAALKYPAASETTEDVQESGADGPGKGVEPKGDDATLHARGVANVAGAGTGEKGNDRSESTGETSPCDSSTSEDERILSEIETGILDIFSDPYCNKHLMYGILELVLVRLMPELAENGIIELWEERLS
ncbi:hypothetical protein JX266_008959 [Neoarthrinium moseri]|nr:hypothetical protein JX266_008959 [Neoarthrinium moseri]